VRFVQISVEAGFLSAAELAVDLNLSHTYLLSIFYMDKSIHLI
jgi:hypothetical protein